MKKFALVCSLLLILEVLLLLSISYDMFGPHLILGDLQIKIGYDLLCLPFMIALTILVNNSTKKVVLFIILISAFSCWLFMEGYPYCMITGLFATLAVVFHVSTVRRLMNTPPQS